MAEEIEPGLEPELDAAPAAPKPTAPPPPAEDGSGAAVLGAGLTVLAIAAVGLTVLGVLSHSTDSPSNLALAAGLLAWGLLDLLGQGKGLFKWSGAMAVWGNSLNLVRAIALMSLGGLLLAQTMGWLKPFSTSSLALIAASGIGCYLLAAFALESYVKGASFTAQATLLAALALQLASYIYFTLPFTFAWAAVLATGSYAFALWAAYAGVLESTPATGRAVLLATLLLGSPFLTFTFEQMFGAIQQPSFPQVMFVSRMRELAGALSPEARGIAWAPRHTQASQPGDIPYSDKVAFFEPDASGDSLVVYAQDDEAPLLTRVAVGKDAVAGAWSNDGGLFAFTDLKGKKRHLRLMQAQGRKVDDWVLSTVSTADPAPGPDHGQIWRGARDRIYYAAPKGDLQRQDARVFRADPAGRSTEPVLKANRTWPAVAPDGSALLSVGYIPNLRYLEIADGEAGHPRRFKVEDEKKYFPAWSANQTRVLFLQGPTLMTMKSNGTQAEPFNADSNMDSKRWLSESKALFTLQWQETGDKWQVWWSKPDGSSQKKIYETRAKLIVSPRWSPDSKRVALAIRQGETTTVVTLDADGSWMRPCFSAEGSVRELRWSPDSLRLAFFLDRSDGKRQETWTAAAQGVDPHQEYLSHGRLLSLTWSPASKHLSFEEVHDWRFLGLRLVRPDLHDVQMVDLAEGRARVMTRYGLMASQPAFSPQGVSLAYFTDHSVWDPGLFRKRTRSLVVTQLY